MALLFILIVISPADPVCVAKAVAGVRKAAEQLELGEVPPSSLLPFDLVGVEAVVGVGSLKQAQTQYPVPGEEDQQTENFFLYKVIIVQCKFLEFENEYM